MARKNIAVLVIDPEKDFMDDADSALPVPGANADMDRLSLMIHRRRRKIDKIAVTIDQHQLLHIAHPLFWVNADGKHPEPMLTVITYDDVRVGRWMPFVKNLQTHAVKYTFRLKEEGKYQLTIWRPHCIIGTKGEMVQELLNNALQEWVSTRCDHLRQIKYVYKGSNPLTEHYGALIAEVPLVDDPGTWLNHDFLNWLREADEILVAGEAFSHCVMATVSQMIQFIGREHVKKIRLLTDCMSCIPAIRNSQTGAMIADFPGITKAWVKKIQRQGVIVTDSVSYWK